MDRTAYALHAAVEGRHWWFRARRRVVASVLTGLSLPHGSTLLEFGSGTGGNLAMLARFGRVWAVEPDDEARSIAAEAAPFAEHRPSLASLPEAARFDAALLLDVIEHLDDPSDDVGKVAALLAPGAPVVVTVPPTPGSSASTIATCTTAAATPPRCSAPTSRPRASPSSASAR